MSAPSGRKAMSQQSTVRWSSACTAVYGSLMAGDRALQAMSICWRIPNAMSCSMVRSNPTRMLASSAAANRSASGGGSSGPDGHTQASTVFSMTCWPMWARRQMVTSAAVAIGSSSSGWTTWR